MTGAELDGHGWDLLGVKYRGCGSPVQLFVDELIGGQLTDDGVPIRPQHLMLEDMQAIGFSPVCGAMLIISIEDAVLEGERERSGPRVVIIDHEIRCADDFGK